jgi:uncharacterized protein (TIGR03067 family)
VTIPSRLFALSIPVLAIGPVASAVDDAKKEAVEAEIKKLEGTWEGFAVEGKGETPDRGPVHLRLVIQGNTISAFDLRNKEKDMGKGTYTIDPTAKFKEINGTGVVLPGKRERKYPGIYELDGDTLKWCVNNRQEERPTEFHTTRGNFLLILKRKK